MENEIIGVIAALVTLALGAGGAWILRGKRLLKDFLVRLTEIRVLITETIELIEAIEKAIEDKKLTEEEIKGIIKEARDVAEAARKLCEL